MGSDNLGSTNLRMFTDTVGIELTPEQARVAAKLDKALGVTRGIFNEVQIHESPDPMLPDEDEHAAWRALELKRMKCCPVCGVHRGTCGCA